jgi:hypothetical protein
MRRWDGLTPEFRALYSAATAIPANYEYHISPGGKFRIFYTTSGVDSVNVVDTMGYGNGGASWRERQSGSNGVPDYIDEVAFALDSAWSMIIERFGFVEPINTAAPDGSRQHYNVLIRYLDDGHYGVTYPQVSRPPSSPALGFPSHIEINSDWSGAIWRPLGYHLRPYDAVRVTAAHEFLHSSQYAMVWTVWLDDLTDGWLEGSAVLMEEIAFPDVDDYLQYIGRFFTNPRVSLLSNSFATVYMNSLLLKYLYEKTNPNDSIGLIKAVHFNNMAQRSLAFARNIEQASQEYAGVNWAEVLNGFHAESYFTGRRARRPWAFVSDAEKMGTWTVPGATTEATVVRSVQSNSVEFLYFTPRAGHPDTLILGIAGERDASAPGKTWAASLLVMEGGDSDSVGILPVQMNQNGSGYVILENWHDKRGCLLVLTNVGRGARSVTVRLEDSTGSITHQAPLTISPNVIRISDRRQMVRISGGNISEIRIITQDGKVLGFWNERNGSNPANGTFKRALDGAVEWHPGRRLTPGICYISAISSNPTSGRRNVRRQKIMLLP